MLLSSCSSQIETTHCPGIPPVLLGHLDKTAFKGRTYGDVTQYAVILKRERDMCLNRIDKIRDWQVELHK
ncbi:Rz1-like lysis system protein LysC [Caviibacterium pharyngocola]|uniref:Lytic protein Rz1 n=1 Tax=Caviibacterium pharyngocola TaxID=28159 RepID=A0A2M8RY40_9PAST|nr:lytic protein Rz1 [Caviibacterium pharyngocola]